LREQFRWLARGLLRAGTHQRKALDRGEEQEAVEEMQIGYGGVANEELAEEVVTMFAFSGENGVSGLAGGLIEVAIGGRNVLGKDGDAEAGQANSQKQVGSIDVLGGEELVLVEGVLEAPGVGQEQGQVEADDLGVAGFVRSTVGDCHIKVAQRVVVSGGFELAEATESHRRHSGGLKLQEVTERIDRLRKLIALVLQLPKVKPALGPVWLELLGLSIELDGKGMFSLSRAAAARAARSSNDGADSCAGDG